MRWVEAKLSCWQVRLASLILVEIDWFRCWRKIYHWSKPDREMSPIPHKLNWTGCVRSFCEPVKRRISKRLGTMAFQKIYFLLCLTFVDSRLWISAPGWQLQVVCIQRRLLWVVLAVFVGFCWWGQSVRWRHLSSFFLIVDASFLRCKVFLCWVSQVLDHFVGLVVEIDLFSEFDRYRPRGGRLSEIFQMLRGRQR